MKTPPIIRLGLTASLFGALLCNPVLNVQAQGKPISLPAQASEIAAGIYDLGTARDANGTIVQGFAFVHYKKGFARPENPGGPKPPKTSSCYAFLASGAKWKVIEDYVFDQIPVSTQAPQLPLPSPDLILAQIETGISAWEDAAGKPILGTGSLGAVDPSQVGTLNDRNEVMFGNITEPGVIAMTLVWGVWGGPPSGRQLVEWDMVFGNDWGWWYADETPDVTAMDFLSIATHELGHAVGLDHPSDTCTEETMYAYADWREIKKRDLNPGDIAGIRKLYP